MIKISKQMKDQEREKIKDEYRQYFFDRGFRITEESCEAWANSVIKHKQRRLADFEYTKETYK